MRRSEKRLNIVVTLFFVLTFGSVAMADFSIEDASEGNRILRQGWQRGFEFPTALLDGTTILYSLFQGDAYEVKFSKGKVTWVGVAGEVKGQKNYGNIRYQAHMFEEGVYMVQWDVIRGDGDYDWANLYIDLNSRTIVEASVVNYGVNSQGPAKARFMKGEIFNVRQR